MQFWNGRSYSSDGHVAEDMARATLHDYWCVGTQLQCSWTQLVFAFRFHEEVNLLSGLCRCQVQRTFQPKEVIKHSIINCINYYSVHKLTIILYMD